MKVLQIFIVYLAVSLARSSHNELYEGSGGGSYEEGVFHGSSRPNHLGGWPRPVHWNRPGSWQHAGSWQGPGGWNNPGPWRSPGDWNHPGPWQNPGGWSHNNPGPWRNPGHWNHPDRLPPGYSGGQNPGAGYPAGHHPFGGSLGIGKPDTVSERPSNGNSGGENSDSAGRGQTSGNIGSKYEIIDLKASSF
nr:LWamide neuropeptides-like [Drosophila suzukii]